MERVGTGVLQTALTHPVLGGRVHRFDGREGAGKSIQLSHSCSLKVNLKRQSVMSSEENDLRGLLLPLMRDLSLGPQGLPSLVGVTASGVLLELHAEPFTVREMAAFPVTVRAEQRRAGCAGPRVRRPPPLLECEEREALGPWPFLLGLLLDLG